MKKIFNFILLFFITILVSCNTNKPPHEHIFIDGKCECGQIDPNKPWDDLGGGGQGDDNKESDITTDDAGNNDYVENPDKDKFEINIEGATYINLSNLSFDSNDYNYADNTLAIEKEGIYVLTGTLNGSVIVKGSASKITIILYNATIETLNTQNTVALLFEKNSGERILSIYEGTINTLSDSIGDDENGDGVDSNGTIELACGITIIYGPTNGGNGSLDADRGILVKGGILVAVGAAGMVETPSSNSTQCCVAYALNGSANSTLKVVDENKKVLFETVCPKTYQSVVISLPEFTIGNSYTISNESSSQTFTIVSILTNALGGGMGPGGMPPGDRPGGGGPRPR